MERTLNCLLEGSLPPEIAGLDPALQRRRGPAAGGPALTPRLASYRRGPSGTGKTTLLRLITRQLIPDAGTIKVDGVDIATLNQRELYKLRRRFGMLFQNGALLTDISVFENVAFPLREHTRLPNRLIRHVVLTKLHAVGLRGAADLMPAQLSGGMARRVALARAMVMDPDIQVFSFVLTYGWAVLGAAFGPQVLLALFWKRASRAGAIAGIATGFVVAVFWNEVYTSEVADRVGMELYNLPVAFMLALVVNIFVSLASWRDESG